MSTDRRGSRCLHKQHAVHVTLLLCVFSNDNKEKNVSKTNYRLDCIWRNSHSDCDIYRVLNAFALYLTSIRKSPQDLHRFITVPTPRHRPHTNRQTDRQTDSSQYFAPLITTQANPLAYKDLRSATMRPFAVIAVATCFLYTLLPCHRLFLCVSVYASVPY